MTETHEPNLNEIIDSRCDNYGVTLLEIIRKKWLIHIKNIEYKHNNPPDDIFLEVYHSYDRDT